MSYIRGFAILLTVIMLCPATVLAQTTRPADAAIRQFSPETGSERSPSADSLPQLAADYQRAMAALDAARQRRVETLAELGRARERVRRELLQSGEVEEARAAMAQAEDEYNRERDRVIEQLQSDPAYVSAKKKVAELDARIESLRLRGTDTTTIPVDDQITALAKQRLHYAAEADRIERSALERDPAYQQARARHLAAVRRNQSAGEQVEQRVEADPAVVQAKERWQEAVEDCHDARTRLATAQAAYVTAMDMYRDKMQYLQTHGPSEPWWPYGYGYGGVVIH
jgi:tetratricopeptide (TPR) repeat protein